MSTNIDFEVSNGISFKDLCGEIIKRCASKRDQLDTLVSSIRDQIKDKNDIQSFMPRIKELIEVGVKNDELIVKLAAVVEKLQSYKTDSEDGIGLSNDEKEQLMQARIDDLETLKKEANLPIQTENK